RTSDLQSIASRNDLLRYYRFNRCSELNWLIPKPSPDPVARNNHHGWPGVFLAREHARRNLQYQRRAFAHRTSYQCALCRRPTVTTHGLASATPLVLHADRLRLSDRTFSKGNTTRQGYELRNLVADFQVLKFYDSTL